MQVPFDLTFNFTTGTIVYTKGQTIQEDFVQIIKAIIWTIKPRKSLHVSTSIIVVEHSDHYEIGSISTSIKTKKTTAKNKILKFSNIVKAASSYDDALINSNDNINMSTNNSTELSDSSFDTRILRKRNETRRKKDNINMSNGNNTNSTNNSLELLDSSFDTRTAKKRNETRRNKDTGKVIIQQIPVIIKQEVIKEVIKEVKVVEEVTKEIIKEIKVGSECPICFDKTINCSLNPCGHVFCLDCANKFLYNNCPNCRLNVTEIKRIYY
jgi:hypothetical protein